MERAAAFCYRLLGREDLRAPRLISVAAWTAGGLALRQLRIAQRPASHHRGAVDAPRAGVPQHGDLGAVEGLDAADVWIPFASVRFWIFFSAFFGLTGTLLTTLTGTSMMIVAIIAFLVGYLSGVAAVAAIRW